MSTATSVSPRPRQRRQALTTAAPQDDVPIEPPAKHRLAEGAVADLELHPLRRDVQRVRGDLGQHRPRAGADVGGGDADGEAPVVLGPARWPWTACGVPGTSTRRRPCRSASGRRGAPRVAGRGPTSRNAPRPPAGSATRWREENGLPLSGSIVRLVADPQLERIDVAARPRARRSRTPARTCPGTLPARASRRASARSARRAGASSGGAATHTSSGWRPPSARRTPAPATSARRRRARCAASRPSSSAPSRSRWIVGVR